MVAGGHRLRDHHHTVGAAMDSVGGVALSDRRDIHLRMPVPGVMGRPLLPVAYRGDLSAEFRMADLDRACRDHSRLAVDEDAKLRPHIADRRRDMGRDGLGL